MTDTTSLIHQAIDLSDDEDYDAALELLSQVITLEPDNAGALFERAMVLMNLDRDAEALPDFDRALALEPDYPGARSWRARALESVGDVDRAAAERLVTLRRQPDGPHPGMGVSPQEWADCAQAFVAAGQPDTARAVLEEYFTGPVSQVTMYQVYATAPMRLMARLLLDSDDSDRALAYARDAAQHENACPADREMLDAVLASRGQLS